MCKGSTEIRVYAKQIFLFSFLFCIMDGAYSDPIKDYFEASLRQQQGDREALHAHLQAQSAKGLFDLARHLASAHDKKTTLVVQNKTIHLMPHGEEVFYELAGILSIHDKKKAFSVPELLEIINDSEESLLFRKTLITYYLSNESPLSPEEKSQLDAGMGAYKKQVSADSKTREMLSHQQADRIREELQSINDGTQTPEDEARKRASLAPRVQAHLREIMDDLKSRPVLDSNDITRLTRAHNVYTALGFAVDKAEIAALMKDLYRDPAKSPLAVRISLAAFLGIVLGEQDYYEELLKIRTDPANQEALKPQPNAGGMHHSLGESLEISIMKPIDTYDKALAFLKTLTPGDSLYNKTAVLVNRMRQEMIDRNEWTRERAQEFIAAYEDALARTTDPREIGPLEGAIRIYKQELEQADSATTSPATTAPAPALSPTPLPSGN